MLPLSLLFALHASTPATLVVTTPRGQSELTVSIDPIGGPVLNGASLLAALGGSFRITEGWIEVTVARQRFTFLVGVPVYRFNDQLEALAAPALVRRDSLFLPFQFVVEILPRVFAERYRYDAGESRFLEVGPRSVAARPEPARLPNGLLPGHLVTLDPGHGGVDPGNPGIYFPRGITEKNVTLQMGLLLREELKQRGIAVRMTRTTDTLIDLADRGAYCTETCDLFVSLHVNALARRRGFTEMNGFETYFLSEAKTEDAERVERMENEAIRFEAPRSDTATDGIDFILRDLQANEYLRESARAAELIQEMLGPVHTGQDRGVKQAGFKVLTTARRPAVLAELGYSTNPNDARLLTNRNSQRALVAAVADAIVDYLLEYERKTGLAGDSGARP